MICLSPQAGILYFSIYFKHAVNLGKFGFFLCPVEGAVFICSLEHKVFEVMRKAGIVGRVAFTAGFHCYKGLYARGILIDCHIHFKSVFEGVDAHIHRVARNGLVSVILLCVDRNKC